MTMPRLLAVRVLKIAAHFVGFLMLLFSGSFAQADLIIQEPPPVWYFQGVMIVSGPIGFCTETDCFLLEPPTYGFTIGTDPTVPLPAPPRSGRTLLDVIGTIGPTQLSELFPPYHLGTDLAGTLSLRLTVERRLLFGEDIRFAIAEAPILGDPFGGPPVGVPASEFPLPGTYAFEALDGKDYFAVVYGAGFGEPVSYRLTIVQGSSIPAPASMLLFALGFAALVLPALRRPAR